MNNPFKSRGLSYGATRTRLIDLGYAPTSAQNPTRQYTIGATLMRASDARISEDPAAVYCRPTEREGCDLADAQNRQLIAFIVTPHGAAHAPTLKALEAVLDKFDLGGGPICRTEDGHLVRPFKFGGERVIREYQTRRVHPDDEVAVRLVQALDVVEHDPWANGGVYDSRHGRVVPAGPARPPVLPRSFIIPLAGEWRGGSLLDVPRAKLPLLYAHDVEELFREIERVRWDHRPAAAEPVAHAR